MMLNRTLIATLLAASFSFFGTSAFAVTIKIDERFVADNSEFEAHVPANDELLGNGWYNYLPNGDSLNGTYFYGQFEAVGTIYNAPRDHVAYFDLKLVQGDPTYPVGMQQTLSQSIALNTQYDLSVAVGNPKSGGGYNYTDFGGYKIQLLAGGTVLDEDDDSKTIGEGDFVTSYLYYETGSTSSFLDQALGIRLIHKNAGINPNSSNNPPVILWGIGFDDIELTISPVPVPAAVWLFGTALIGLIGFGKRRKTA
jgi:hypothetical protein